MLEDGFQQEWVPRKPSGRFREISVELKFARLWQSFRFLNTYAPILQYTVSLRKPKATHLDKCRKRWVRALLLLKFVLAVQLVRTIIDERVKLRHVFLKDIANLADDGKLLLSLGEGVPETCVGVDDRLQVPEHLRDEVVPFLRRGYDIGISETFDPDLSRETVSTTLISNQPWTRTHLLQVFHIPHEIPFGINNLINRLLAPLLRVAERIRDFLRDRVDPQRARVGPTTFTKAFLRDLMHKLALGLHVQPGLLLHPPRARDRVAQLRCRARRRVALGQHREHAGR